MGLMEFQELMKGGSATFEAMEVKCRGRMRKERERRLDQRVIIKRGDVTKFHGIGLSVEETQDAESNYQHSAERRGEEACFTDSSRVCDLGGCMNWKDKMKLIGWEQI